MPTDDAITAARTALKLRNQLEYSHSGRCLTGRRPSLSDASQPHSPEAIRDAMTHLSVNRSGNPQHVRRKTAPQQDSEAAPASPSTAETECSPARASQGSWLRIREAQLASELADEKLADEKRADEKSVSFRVEPKRCTRMATTSRLAQLKHIRSQKEAELRKRAVGMDKASSEERLSGPDSVEALPAQEPAPAPARRASSNSKKGDKVIDIKQRSSATLSKVQKRAMKCFKDRQRSGGPAMAGWSGASKLELDVGDTVTTVAISEDNTLFAVGSTNKKATVYAARSSMPIEPAIR